MKLYIQCCDNCRHKIPLDAYAETRSQFRYRFGERFSVQCPHCRQTIYYNVSRVKAETDSNSTIGGGIVGGLIGLLGGPVGFLIGAGLGAGIGNNTDNEDLEKVKHFNSSH